MADNLNESPPAERVASGCPSRGARSQHIVDTKNSKSVAAKGAGRKHEIRHEVKLCAKQY